MMLPPNLDLSRQNHPIEDTRIRPIGKNRRASRNFLNPIGTKNRREPDCYPVARKTSPGTVLFEHISPKAI